MASAVDLLIHVPGLSTLCFPVASRVNLWKLSGQNVARLDAAGTCRCHHCHLCTVAVLLCGVCCVNRWEECRPFSGFQSRALKLRSGLNLTALCVSDHRKVPLDVYFVLVFKCQAVDVLGQSGLCTTAVNLFTGVWCWERRNQLHHTRFLKNVFVLKHLKYWHWTSWQINTGHWRFKYWTPGARFPSLPPI